MKKIRNIKLLSAVAASSLLFFSSCLKNNQYYIDFSKVAPSIELPLSAPSGSNYFNQGGIVTKAFTIESTPTSLPVLVNIASPNPLGSSVTATLAIDTNYIASYNAANGTSYEPLPDSDFQSPASFNVTVPAGKRIDSVVFQINTSKIDLNHQYILSVTIANASIPVSSWKHLMMLVTAKNQWDGTYYADVILFYAPNPAYDGEYPGNTTFATVNGNTVITNLGVYPLFGANMTITINGDNSLTLASTAVTIVQDAGLNYYDPGTKTFYFSYGWGAGSRHITGTAVFVHP